MELTICLFRFVFIRC